MSRGIGGSIGLIESIVPIGPITTSNVFTVLGVLRLVAALLKTLSGRPIKELVFPTLAVTKRSQVSALQGHGFTHSDCASLVAAPVHNLRDGVLAFYPRRFSPQQVHIQVVRILCRERTVV